MKRLDTRLDGPILLAPDVFGDERGFFCETYRRSALHGAGDPRGDGPGQPLALARAAWCAGCTSRRARRGQARALRARRDLRRARRRAPRVAHLRQWEGFELSDENMHLLYAPVGFAHGFCVLSDTADVLYKQDAYYDARLDRGLQVRRSRRRHRLAAAGRRALLSQRDLDAPLLRDVADDLPFEYR